MTGKVGMINTSMAEQFLNELEAPTDLGSCCETQVPSAESLVSACLHSKSLRSYCSYLDKYVAMVCSEGNKIAMLLS